MSEDINVTDGTVLECLNNKVDLDGGNYVGSPLETYIHEHCAGTALDGKITNCITEIPQRIKYTLGNGTLTIKAGSVVIVPYGTTDRTSEFPVGATFINENFKVYDTCYADGKFFVWAEIVEDISQTTSVSDTQDRPFFISLTGNFISALMYSGSGTSDYTGTGNYYLYRTDENIMKRYMSGTFDDGVCSLPLGICTSNGSTTYSSIKQVFNGFGYIGSIKWIDTGVIGLASNGKNPDGSLNNIQWERNSILLKDVGNSGSAEYIDIYTTDGSWYNTLSYTVSETEPTTKTQAYWWYNPSINEHFKSDGTEWIKKNATIIGSSSKVDGKIILFNAKQPFRAVDYNDLAEVKNNMLTATMGKSNNGYCKFSNGLIIQWGQTPSFSGTTTVTLPTPFTTANYRPVATPAAGGDYDANWDVRDYTTTSFRINQPSSGSKAIAWHAIGY